MKILSHLEIIKKHLIAQETPTVIPTMEKMEKHIDKYMISYTMEDPKTNMTIQVVMATIGSYNEQITTITRQDYRTGSDMQFEGAEAIYFTPEGKQLLDIVIGNLIHLYEAILEEGTI